MNTQLQHKVVRSRNDGSRRVRVGMGMLLAGALASSGLTGILTAGTASAVVPTFPDNLVVFPNRDFLTVEGYQDRIGQTATVEISRAGVGVVGSAQGVISGDDVAFEVNHPGGYCWGNGTGLNVTPDIQPGDVASISFPDPLDPLGDPVPGGNTTVQDAYVSADASQETTTLTGDTVVVRGHIGASVIQDQTEQRIVEPALTDTVIGRRDVRALPGPMTTAPKGGYSSGLAFNDTAKTFTATYIFDDPAVAEIAANAGLGERMLSWEVVDADANRQGITIGEFGEPGGPGMGGCPNGPLQSGPPAPTNMTAANVNGGIKLTWTPAVAIAGTPAVTGYRATAVAQTFTNGEQIEIGRRITGQGATGTTITGLLSTESYQVEVVSVSSVGETFPAATVPVVTDITPPEVSASPAGGSFATPQEVTLTANEAGSQIFFTTDDTDPVESQTALHFTEPFTVSTNTTVKFVAFDPTGNVSPVVTQVYDITNTPTPATPAFTTTSVGTGSVTLNWADGNPADTSITGYSVQVYDGAGTATVGEPRPTTERTMTITDLTADTPYRFTVVAINANGSSQESSMVGPLTPLGAVVANAGPDQSVARQTIPITVTLNGAGSTPGASYSWSQLATGSVNPIPAGDPNEVTLNDSTTLSPSFTLPLYKYPMTNKPLTFRLTVTEGTNVRTDDVLVTPRPDQVSVITARWKNGDFRVTGAGSVVGATITVHQDSLGGAVLGRATVTAAVLGGDFSLRLRNGAAPAISPGTIWIESTVGGTSGPFTVTR